MTGALTFTCIDARTLHFSIIRRPDGRLWTAGACAGTGAAVDDIFVEGLTLDGIDAGVLYFGIIRLARRLRFANGSVACKTGSAQSNGEQDFAIFQG